MLPSCRLTLRLRSHIRRLKCYSLQHPAYISPSPIESLRPTKLHHLQPAAHIHTQPIFPMSGLLIVFGEPGSAVADAEFNDWYDNEHIPLRLPVASFRSWSRWAATDARAPTYMAMYDLASPASVHDPAYASLADTRSAREKDIIARLAVLDRRIYERLPVPIPPKDGEAYEVEKPGPFMMFVSVDVPEGAEEDFGKWYDEEHVPLFSKMPEWVRTTRWVYKEGGASGTDDALKPKDGRPQKFLALHEWTDLGVKETEAFKAAIATEWSQKSMTGAISMDIREFKLLKTWKRD